MTEANVEIFRQIIAAFNESGMDGVLRFFDEEIELYDPDLPAGKPIRGHAALSEAFAPMLDSWESIAVRYYEFIPAGDRVVAMVHTAGQGSGVRGEMEVEFRDAHTMTFRDGKVVYWRLYQDRREALADAGLDPGLADEQTA